jgi:hypothetical protein
VTRPGLVNEDGDQMPVTGSPRIVCVPAFDPGVYRASTEIRISNIFGFFVGSVDPMGNVSGWLTKCPGVGDGTGSLPVESAFIPIIHLVR